MFDPHHLEVVAATVRSIHFWWIWVLGSLVGLWLLRNRDDEADRPPPPMPPGSSRRADLVVLLAGLVVALVCSFPYWMAGAASAAGNADDIYLVVASKLAAERSASDGRWCGTVAGGCDVRLFPGALRYTLLSIYARVFPPWLMTTWIMLANVLLVLFFSWRLLVDTLGTHRCTAFLGAMTLALVQGYYVGNWPDAHVGQLHGMATIPALLYVADRRVGRRSFPLVMVALGVFQAAGTPYGFHNVPPAVLALALWLVWMHPSRVRASLSGLALFAAAATLCHLEYILVVLQNLPQSARVHTFQQSVALDPGLWKSTMAALGLLAVGWWKRPGVRDRFGSSAGLFLTGTVLVPFGAYLLQESRVMPSYRWNLLYNGNHALYVLPACLLIDAPIRALWRSCRWVALPAGRFAVLLVECFLVAMFVNGLAYDLWLLHQCRWDYLTAHPLIARLATLDKRPFRIASYGTHLPMNCIGWAQGMETAGGYNVLLSGRVVEFWRKMLTVEHESVRHLYIPVNQRCDLADVRVPMLKLLNVTHVVSRHLLTDPRLERLFAEELAPDACGDPAPAFVPSVLDDASTTLETVACRLRHSGFRLSLFVYRLKDPLPRAYCAARVRHRGAGQECLDPDFLSFIDGGNAVVTASRAFGGEVDFGRGDPPDLVEAGPDRFVWRTRGPTARFVVLCMVPGPFWRLCVNGTPTPVHTVNLVQTGVEVPPGESTVELTYCPPVSLAKPLPCAGAPGR